MKDNYRRYEWFEALSDADQRLVETLRDAQMAQGDMLELQHHRHAATEENLIDDDQKVATDEKKGNFCDGKWIYVLIILQLVATLLQVIAITIISIIKEKGGEIWEIQKKGEISSRTLDLKY